MSNHTATHSDDKRKRELANSIRLRWALAGHPTTNLRLHSALRSCGVPKAMRPRNVEQFRREWTVTTPAQVKEPTPAPKLFTFTDWQADFSGTFIHLTLDSHSR